MFLNVKTEWVGGQVFSMFIDIFLVPLLKVFVLAFIIMALRFGGEEVYPDLYIFIFGKFNV